MTNHEQATDDSPLNHRGTKSTLGRWLRRIFLFVFIPYFALIGLLVLNESSLVYPGSSPKRGNWEPRFPHEEISFTSSDGTELVGWYLPQPGATEEVLVCHGNAENVAQSSAHTGLKFQAVLNANVFVFDYRGYGKSKGSPHEQGVLQDAKAAMHWLCKKSNKKPTEINVVGHSIGGGPAVYLASQLGAKTVYLQRTFSSLVEPAQNKYWFVPVSLVMRNRFESSERIKACSTPLHQSHGDLDNLVPIWSGRKLFDNSPADMKTFFINEGKGHWDALPMRYWDSVKRFNDRVNAAKTS